MRGLEAALSGGPSGIYNLGTGTGYSNREVIAAVERLLGRSVAVRERPRRAGDPPILVADASRFQRDFGWRPVHSDLETIVDTAWTWLREWRGLSASYDATRAASRAPGP